MNKLASVCLQVDRLCFVQAAPCDVLLPWLKNQRVEKGLIDGVGFSRLTENVRFPSSQVVHCNSTKEMQIYRTDVLFLFSPPFVGRSNPSLQWRLCWVRSGCKTKVLTREKPCHPGTCDGGPPFRAFSQ